MKERRIASIERVHVELGQVKQITQDTRDRIETLNERVGIQNGRVAELEKWRAFIQGVVAVLVVLVIPLSLRIIGTWLDEIIKRGGI